MPTLNTSDNGVTIQNDDGTSSFIQSTTEDLGENFSYLQNPNNPNQTLAIGNADLAGEGSLGQILSDLGGYNPVGNDVFNVAPTADPAAPGAPGANSDVDVGAIIGDLDYGTDDVTSSLAFGDELDLRSQVDAAGASARSAEEERQITERAEQEAIIGSQFDPKIAELVEFKEDQADASRGRFGLDRRLSTAGEAYVQDQKSRVQKQINDLEKRKELAIRSLNSDLADNLSDVIKEARDQEMQLLKLEQSAQSNKFNQLSTLMGLQIQAAAAPFKQAQLQLDTLAKVPVGETITIGGVDFQGTAVADVDPFWTSASIVSLAKTLPVGTTKTVEDPKYGTITVEGMKTDDPNTQIFHSVNQNNGDETYTTMNKDTGEILNQTVSKGIGSRFKAGDGSNTNLSKEKKAFYTDIDGAVGDLRAGSTWGQVWQTLFTKYKHPEGAEGASEQNTQLGNLLDTMLDKETWSQFGAYQDFKGLNKDKKMIGAPLYHEDGSKTVFYSDGSSEIIQ